MSSIAERLDEVRTRIARAALAVGRDPQSVRLVAVSKTHSTDAVREAYAAGQREFGENYAQELAKKAEALSDLPDLHFRFIGGFQRNKGKLLAGAASAVETIANAGHVDALSAQARAVSRRIEVMIQVNAAFEAQKSGVAPAGVGELVARVRASSALELTGLMVIPKAGDEAAARASYRAVRELAQEHGLSQLSMGMSDDFELAIAEGSTSVRVGTAIFGPRPL